MLPLILVVSLLGHCAADILDNGITCHSEVDLSPDTLDYLQQRGISLKNSPLTNTQCSSLPDAWGNVSCVTLTAGSETIKGCSNDPILMSLELCKHELMQEELSVVKLRMIDKTPVEILESFGEFLEQTRSPVIKKSN
ncbi:hypothetical protein QR680_010181 [Steinernema hermaphroditum]|uniref:Uncharacterized protein n=1 Tax=Steinernema hermaphroditum TaxID=289476 RepID=A0AA39MA81_9BILA|nr:hypothetical protein QR680_010181 [Steinernema hermaphroditum]